MKKVKIAILDRIDSGLSPGGDTKQISEIVSFLRIKGYDVTTFNELYPDLQGFDFAFVFNLTRYRDALYNSLSCIKQNIKYILFPIYWNFNEINMPIYSSKSFIKRYIIGSRKNLLKTYHELYFSNRSHYEPNIMNEYKELFLSEKTGIEFILNNAHVICPNSNAEMEHLKKHFNIDEKQNFEVILNGIEKDLYKLANIKATSRDGIYCVGGIGPRKNQLTLGKACVKSNSIVNLIGKANVSDVDYYNKVRKYEGYLNFLGWKSHDEVINTLAKAKVHIQPSLIETPGLASMEAYALGCRLILSDVAPVREYFNDRAIYVNPNSISDITKALEDVNSSDSTVIYEDIKEFNKYFEWNNVLIGLEVFF